MPRVIHFEIPAQNLRRAMNFYQGIFGWEMEPWPDNPDYVQIRTGPDKEPGIHGAIIRREGPVVNTVQVESVDETAARVVQTGGEIVVPKQPIPQVGWLIYCQDTEGNVFGLVELDDEAT